jgi:branched-chain amino acid transport system ATP-binding protein
MSQNHFETSHITLRFGGVVSINDVTMHHRRGEILAVIGPNGAGKTSLFNSLSGLYRPQDGTIQFFPETGSPVNVLASKPHQLNKAGIARTFQASRMFNALTVFENVKIAAESHRGIGAIGAIVRGPATRRDEKISDDLTWELLDFVGLTQRANDIAASISYGERRRLEIARGLATRPEVLLLDEPAAGTNPSEKVELTALIRRVRDERGVSILIIEHDMRMVMSLAERLYVLNFGSVIAEGTPDEVRANPAVIEAYLGSSKE